MTLYKLPWLLKKLVINPILSLITRYSMKDYNNMNVNVVTCPRVPSVEEVYTSTTSLTEAMLERNLFVKVKVSVGLSFTIEL